jgi:hypothetical protein
MVLSVKSAYVEGDVAERLLGVGHRQEVVRVLPGPSREAQVIGHPAGARPVAQRAELGEVGAVERVSRADRERDPVHHDRVPLGDGVEEVERLPRRVHVVLAQDLEPGDGGMLREDVRVVHGP